MLNYWQNGISRFFRRTDVNFILLLTNDPIFYVKKR